MFKFTASLAVLILASCINAQSFLKADDLNERGLRLYESGDYDAALKAFNQAIELTSRLAKPKPLKNNIFPPEKAEEVLIADQVRVVDPRTAIALVNRGNVYFAKWELDRALADYNEAIRISPSLADAYVARASVWLINRDFQRALDDQSKAVKIDAKNVKARIGRSLTL